MKKSLLLTLILAIVVPLISVAQYRNPLDQSPLLAGNFGELRGVSFHAGIDFKTSGVEGKRVYAVADGYVSRVFVSPFGYGKAIYVTHPALGSTTVYAHLRDFSPQLDSIVKKRQYSSQSYRQDIYLKQGQVNVKSGELIGYSGNTGTSGGPHVHFEIREGGLPVNILAKGYYNIADTISPKLFAMFVIEVDSIGGVSTHNVAKRYPLTKTADGYRITSGEKVKISKPSYLAFEITDRKNNVNNTFGTSDMSLEIEGEHIFGYSIDKLSYGKMRYVSTFRHYGLDLKTRNDVIRAYRSPNNKLTFYQGVKNRGIITPSSIDSGESLATFKDDNGNISRVVFTLEKGVTPPPSTQTPKGELAQWMFDYNKYDKDYRVSIASQSLFESIYIESTATKDPKSPFSPLVTVGDRNIPLAKSYELEITADSSLSESQLSKALIVSISDSGKKSALSSKVTGRKISAKPSSFGRFRVDVDSLAPRISPMYKPAESQSAKRSIAFKITDDLSGIASYAGYVDGNWVVFEYEPKKNMIEYKFDNHITKGGSHTIKVEVIDGKGNKKSYNGKFTY